MTPAALGFGAAAAFGFASFASFAAAAAAWFAMNFCTRWTKCDTATGSGGSSFPTHGTLTCAAP